MRVCGCAERTQVAGPDSRQGACFGPFSHKDRDQPIAVRNQTSESGKGQKPTQLSDIRESWSSNYEVGGYQDGRKYGGDEGEMNVENCGDRQRPSCEK